jgi:WD40 repeat protein
LQPELSVDDCEDIAEHFDRLSLLDMKRDGSSRMMTMHDMLLMYAREKLDTKEPEMHRQFLAAHNPDGGEWSSVAGSYVRVMLLHHLTAAGFDSEVRRLLFDFRWIAAKLDATGVSALVLDYGRLQTSTAARLVRKALRLAATTVEKDRDQLAGQLLARLPAGDAEIDRLLAGARSWGRGKTWLRPTRPGLIQAGGCLQQTFEGNHLAEGLFYREGSVIEAYCTDGLVRHWDMDQGAVAKVTPRSADDDREYGLRSSFYVKLDESRVVAGGLANRELKVLNLATDACELVIQLSSHGYAHDLRAIEVLDERRVITGSSQYDICVWDLDSGSFVHRLRGHEAAIKWLERIDANRFASLAYDGTVRIWDVSPDALAVERPRHTARIQALAASSRGVISVGMDGRVLLWELEGQAAPAVLSEDADWAGAFFALDDNRILGSIPQLSVWQIDPPELLFQVDYGGRVYRVTRVDDDRIAVGCGDGHVQVWGVRSGKVLDTWRPHTDSVVKVVSVLSRFVASIGEDRSIAIRDLDTGMEITALDELSIAQVGGSDDRYAFFRAERDGALQVWDWTTGNRFDGSVEPAAPLPLPANEHRIACCSQTGALLVFDVRTRSRVAYIGADVHNFKEDTIGVKRTIWWLGRNHIITGSKDHGVRVWNLTTSECEACFFADGAIAALDVVAESGIVVLGDDIGNLQILKFEQAQ